MDSREVNEIMVKLLAAADKIDRREREEILHLVGRLSRAATRERSTAFDEMHYLDRKIRQLQDELRRLNHHNPLLRRSPVARPRSRPMVGAYDRPRDDLLQAPRYSTTPLLNYGSDDDHVTPRPDEPTRMATAASNAPVAPRAQVRTPARVPRVPAPASSLRVATQYRGGYGHFNEARLLAITAHAGSGDDSGRSSVPAPALPKPFFTAANAEPLAPRLGKRELSIESPVHVGQKRKGPDPPASHVTASNKRNKVAGEIQVAAGTVLPLGPNMRIVMGPDGSSTPGGLKGYSCIQCVYEGLTDCDGKAHCNKCRGRCKYVLCDTTNCRGETCIKIHPSQYDLNARKPGETRMFVVYDNQKEESLTLDEQIHLRGALARIDALRTGTTTNTSETMLQLGAPVAVPGTQKIKKEDSEEEPRTSALPTGVPIFGANVGQSHGAQAENDQHSQAKPWPTGASYFGGINPWKPHDAQATFSARAPVFGSSAWQANGAQEKGKGKGVAQADPFAIPQAVRNAALKAQLSAESDALSLRMGNAFHKAEERDAGETE